MDKDKIFQEVKEAIQSEKEYFEGCEELLDEAYSVCVLDRIQQRTLDSIIQQMNKEIEHRYSLKKPSKKQNVI